MHNYKKHSNKKFILDSNCDIMFVMEKLVRCKEKPALYRVFKYRYTVAICTLSLLLVLATGCDNTVSLVNTPTPVPTNTIIPVSTPNIEVMNSSILDTDTSANATPNFNEEYEILAVSGNSGANIENGGLSTSDAHRIYYIDNGIWSMAKDGTDSILITDMQNIACLNNVNNHIYFLSAHDGSIYRVPKEENSTPEFLRITGASNLVVVGDYLYYSYTIGENANSLIYKSPLNGTGQECLYIMATNIYPDGAYFYYNNLEDNSSLWRYDTIEVQVVKISDDKATQINIIDKKIYYISEDSDYNVVCIDRNGLNPIVVVTQACTDLNIIKNYLIYRTVSTGYIQSYNLKTGEKVSLVKYDELFSLGATDSMMFFQSSPAKGYDLETYIYNMSTSKTNKSIPQKVHAYIKDIRLRDLTFDYDVVDFFTGQEAIEQYSAYNSTTISESTEAISSDDGAYYIYNRNMAWIRGQSLEWTSVTLMRKPTSINNNTPYTASLEEIKSLYDSNQSIRGKLVFELTIVDKKVVSIDEAYYTINNNQR